MLSDTFARKSNLGDKGAPLPSLLGNPPYPPLPSYLGKPPYPDCYTGMGVGEFWFATWEGSDSPCTFENWKADYFYYNDNRNDLGIKRIEIKPVALNKGVQSFVLYM